MKKTKYNKENHETFWLYNELYGAISHEWCGCLAHVVLVLNTYGADSMHQISEGLRPLLYMEG